MASSQLSPKKYIETRARTLPIYKCFVTKGWKEAGEADVIVMRSHVNGNVTAGFYLVDLMCLGVKDTFYFFNEPEAEIYKRLPTEIDEMFDEVEYALAHNIIYAGHDFALEYGIDPAKEFAVTRFILEEDNDNIPIIDIPVGDEDGLPHLIVHHPGEHSNALARLIKNAGEGNYRYTISGLTDDDFDDNDEEYEDVIDDYDLGRITPLIAAGLSHNELYDFDQAEERTGIEKVTLITEQDLRELRKKKPDRFDPAITDTEDYEQIDNSEFIAAGITEEEEDTFLQKFENDFLVAEELPNGEREEYTRDLLDRYADKLLIATALFEIEFGLNGKLISLARSRIEDLQMYPLAKLDLALANILEPAPQPGFEDIYEQKDILKWFPPAELPGDKDLATFWLIQVMVHLKKDDLLSAIYYYYLYSEINVTNFMVAAVQVELSEAIRKEINKK
ncbi:hypothetical protein FC093_21340 [Ilyomonas limi]|uniref:Uncharacterized protein n=1 Tax=Ilyomonas limi TaxID=2575867 RepID=A0A4U3KRN9_9BACT|nr:hypothetical protein [Ilyomonas limi]TKK64922.1 hypothetical protein FC093_21340 [Ilyomonas limi]